MRDHFRRSLAADVVTQLKDVSCYIQVMEKETEFKCPIDRYLRKWNSVALEEPGVGVPLQKFSTTSTLDGLRKFIVSTWNNCHEIERKAALMLLMVKSSIKIFRSAFTLYVCF